MRSRSVVASKDHGDGSRPVLPSDAVKYLPLRKRTADDARRWRVRGLVHVVVHRCVNAAISKMSHRATQRRRAWEPGSGASNRSGCWRGPTSTAVGGPRRLLDDATLGGEVRLREDSRNARISPQF